MLKTSLPAIAFNLLLALAATTPVGCGEDESSTDAFKEAAHERTLSGTIVIDDAPVWEPHPLAEQRAILAAHPFAFTDKLPVGPDTAERPPVYYVEIYVQNKHQLRELEEMGIHYSGAPLFDSEWPSTAVTVEHRGDPDDHSGQYVFALMPAAVYNALHDPTMGDPLYKSIVVRDVPADVRAPDGTVSYDALALLAPFAAPHGELVEGQIVSPPLQDVPQEKGIGRLVRKAVRKIVAATRTVVDGVRRGIAGAAKLFKEETRLRLSFVASSRSEGFSGDMLQAWGDDFDKPLRLTNTRINVRQLGGWGLSDKYTDANGTANISALRGKATRICIETDSNAARFEKGVLMPVETCSKPFITQDREFAWTFRVSTEDVASMAQFIDARNYAARVLGYKPPKAAVQRGWIAKRFSADNRAFVPCLASTNAPNTVVDAMEAALNTGGALAGTLLPVVLGAPAIPIPIGTFVEMSMTTDIMLPDGSADGRATVSHEYGHYVLCNLLASTNPHAYNVIWGEVTAAALANKPDSEIRAVNEGFADFFASQVTGGTVYYADGAHGTKSSGDFFFDVASSSQGGGMEANVGSPACTFAGAPAAPNCQAADLTPLTRNAGSVATLLHDIVDRANCTGACANTVSDVSSYSGLTLQRGSPIAVDDEQIHEPVSRVADIFRRLARNQIVGQAFNRDNLYDYIREELTEYAPEALCDLIAMHSTLIPLCTRVPPVAPPPVAPPMPTTPVVPPVPTTPVVPPVPTTPVVPPVPTTHTVVVTADGGPTVEISTGGASCPASGCTVPDGGAATVSVMVSTTSMQLQRLTSWTGCQVTNSRFEAVVHADRTEYRYTADIAPIWSDLNCHANIGPGAMIASYVLAPTQGTVDVALSGAGDCVRDQPVSGMTFCIVAPGVVATQTAVPAPGFAFASFECPEASYTFNPRTSAPAADNTRSTCSVIFAPN